MKMKLVYVSEVERDHTSNCNVGNISFTSMFITLTINNIINNEFVFHSFLFHLIIF